MHYGLLPRANRGIFAINELPDLAGKIQVGLFNILQEGDVQIKGYPVRLPLDVLIVFTANPGGLHGARQDHHAAQGPHRRRDPHPLHADARDAMAITEQEAWVDGAPCNGVPRFVREVVEEIAFQARAERKIDKRSGVSQRLPISVLENRGLERRAARARQRRIAGRAARHRHLRGAAVDDRQVRARVRRRAQGRRPGGARADPRAVANVFDGYFGNADLRPVVRVVRHGRLAHLG